MASESVLIIDPRLSGVAQALNRAIPVQPDDKEAKDELRLAHRIDLKERVRK